MLQSLTLQKASQLLILLIHLAIFQFLPFFSKYFEVIDFVAVRSPDCISLTKLIGFYLIILISNLLWVLPLYEHYQSTNIFKNAFIVDYWKIFFPENPELDRSQDCDSRADILLI